jgi:hypothetical protein
MVEVPKAAAKADANPCVQQKEALAVHRGEQSLESKVNTASVPRKAISLADFGGIKREVDEAKDFLYVPKELIPDGIAIEWKRKSVLNKEDKKHSAEVWRAGWRFLPSNSEGFAEHFASFVTGDIFEYEGLVLMYRPQSMSDSAKKEESRKAGALVKDKFDEMGYNSPEKDIPGKRFKLERGFEEKLPGGNPAAVAVPE